VEQTVYNLSNVPLLREGVIDSALLVLHDWAHYVSFEDAEIDLERGVIREEWRMYGSANERMSNKLAPVIYKDSKYAKRDVIGDTAVINHFKYETIRSFYNTWYRTDLQAIIVVGDFDLDQVEAKIKKLFSNIPRAENAKPKEIFPLPDNKEPLIATAKDVEATATEVEVSFKHDAIKDEDKNVGYMRTVITRNLINMMIRGRMTELSRSENPPFLSAFSYYGNFTKTKDAFSASAQAANNQGIKAITALLTELERVKRFGFTAGEFERAKADLMRNYESRYMDRDKRKNRELVYPNVSYFLTNNPNPGIEFEYKFANAMVPGIALEELNTQVSKYVTEQNMIITATGPDVAGVSLPTEAEIKNVLATYKNAKIEAYVDKLAGKKLISKEPTPGKVVKVSENKTFNTTEWELSNGIKVIFKPTDIKEDELMIRGFSAGGQSVLKDDEIPVAGFLSSAVQDMGVGEFSRTDLTKLLAGKRVSIVPMVTSEQDVISARTSPKDIETALQMIYLYFTQPRWNETDYKNWYDKVKADYINADAEPRKAFGDTISVMVNSHSPRAIPMSYKQLEKVSLAKLKDLYTNRFIDPNNFTFILVGKVDPALVKPLFEKYMASLPPRKREEHFYDDGVRPPKGKVTNDFRRENKTPRSSVYVNYNGISDYSFDDRLYGAAMRHCLELRYIESIREDEGGAYSVRTSFSVNKYPVPGFRMVVSFDTDPLKTDKLVGIVHREANKMRENGPTEIDLQKAREYFIKQRQEDLKENTWWLSTLGEYYFYGMDFMTGYEEKVKALDTKTIHNFAKKVLSQGNIIEVVMRP
jgi:zinc protease